MEVGLLKDETKAKKLPSGHVDPHYFRDHPRKMYRIGMKTDAKMKKWKKS